nr:MAG TPA: hypothetical protein [Bacteriophage sp.]
MKTLKFFVLFVVMILKFLIVRLIVLNFTLQR